MIECIFTIDYEIYGNGEGSLKDLVYEPAERLMAVFRKWNARFVAFIEVAELEIIENKNTDKAIGLVKQQIRELYEDGFELGLHLHPQWYNGRYENGHWHLDYSEYNLCAMPRERILQIVDRSITYLREVSGNTDFRPFSFRAGNWLFQPSKIAAEVLSQRGIKIDSSVFKGGVQHNHQLDYRPALKNDYFWRFQDDVNIADSDGRLVEIPIYTTMVPFWNMLTGRRLNIQRKSAANSKSNPQKKRTNIKANKLNRFMDYLRPFYPLKFDFCRMTLSELKSVINRVIKEDREDPQSYKPIVAIGHTKDPIDLNSVDSFLSFLNEKNIYISTFEKAYKKVLTP